MFNKIISLSLNPAIDITLWTDTLHSGDNIVESERYDAAGKSMNVSRALRAYGVESTAIVLLGKHNIFRYEDRLINEKMNYKVIVIDGYTRENLSIVQPDHTITRLMRDGFCVEHEKIQEILNILSEEIVENSLVVISGKLPRGISPNVLMSICKHIDSLGAKISIDTSSLSMEEIIKIKPFIVKPNLEEACHIAQRQLVSEQDVIDFGKELNNNGITHCMVSAGADGIYYTSTENPSMHILVPSIDVCSTVGAGDCSLAGFIYSLQEGKSIEKALKVAAAFGTAACLTEGTNPPPKLSYANILQQVYIEKV